MFNLRWLGVSRAIEGVERVPSIAQNDTRRVLWKNMLFARLAMVRAIFLATTVVVSIAKGQGS